jgi:hypothetical protein
MGHKLQMYENLRDMLEREVGEIERRHELNKDSLDNLYKLSMSLKVVNKCIDRQEMEEQEKKGGMSMDGQSRNSYGPNSYNMPRYSMEGQSNEGNSNIRPWMGNTYDGQSNAMYRDGRSYDGQSNARRGRDGDGDGRYNESRDNFRNSQDRGWSNAEGNSYEYSRDASRQKMVKKLETLMDDTMSEKERNAIKDCIMKIDNK